MDDEEYGERVKDVVSLILGIYDDLAISRMEKTLETTSSDVSPVPMPNTAHPAYSHVMDFVRDFNQNHVVVAKAPSTKAYDKQMYPTEQDLVKKTILTRHTAWGPAPFIGDPRLMKAVYTWPVWIDDLNRGVGGEATLEIVHRTAVER